jgi:hypothetical protein
MGRHERDLAVLERLLEATRRGDVVWRGSESGEWFEAGLAGREINFRFLYFEATNQVGADRQAIEFNMPGLNARFFCGTEGFDLLLDILGAAFEGWRGEPTSDYAMTFLNGALSGDPATEFPPPPGA